MDDRRFATLAQALAHPTRAYIVRLLASRPECAGKELFSHLPLAQSTVSQHLSILKRAGVVKDRPFGTSRLYCLEAEAIASFARELEAIAACAACTEPDGLLNER